MKYDINVIRARIESANDITRKTSALSRNRSLKFIHDHDEEMVKQGSYLDYLCFSRSIDERRVCLYSQRRCTKT